MDSLLSKDEIILPRKRARRRRISITLTVWGVVFGTCWLLVISMIAVDPLDLYSWGFVPKLKEADYGPDAPPYLVDVVAKDDAIDTLLIGGSNSVPFRREMMESILPKAHNAFNLSYHAPRAGDRNLVTEQVERYTHAKRVLLALDWFYTVKSTTAVDVEDGQGFPVYLYDRNPLNDVRALGLKTIRLTFATLLGEASWLPSWDWSDYRRDIERQYRAFQTSSRMDMLRRQIAAHRHDVDLPTSLTCADFVAVNKQLLPFLRSMSSKRIALDIFVPPYSLAFYYAWIADPGMRAWVGGTLLSDQLLLRSCLVNATDGLEGVRVFAFDDNWLTGDLKYYRDPAHPYGDEVYAFLLHAIADGKDRLTTQNIQEKNDALHRRVKDYVLTNTGLWSNDASRN